MFVCNDGTILTVHLFCDGKNDCKYAEDERNCSINSDLPSALALCYKISPLHLHFFNEICPFSQKHTGKISCTISLNDIPQMALSLRNTDHSHKSTLKDKCIYKLDNCGYPINHLENGNHLVDCEFFKCNSMYFKCPGFYCIPYRYVCDGKVNCPGALDEEKCSRVSCPGQYKCNDSVICLDLQSLCDVVLDCPGGDDERLCTQKVPDCLEECVCLFFSIYS